MSRSTAVRGALVAALLSTVWPLVASSAAAATPLRCDLVAAPTGSDAAAGSASAPFRTAQRLVDATPTGATGCLRTGTYAQDVNISRPGVTLTSFAGERATLKGRLWIKRGANAVTVRDLDLNGINADRLPSPTVNGNDARFVSNDVTNDNTEICFILGNASYGRALRTMLERNRIHHCGRLPSTNEDHGIYVAAADDTQIIDNVIYANVDRGIQLYPDAQRTVVRGNVIDGNGVGIIFSGADGRASNGTQVTGNVVSNSRIRSNVESWYPAGNPRGTGNVVSGNCIAGGAVNTSGGGFTAAGNVSGDPRYADAGRGDFRMSAANTCNAVLRASGAPASTLPVALATGPAPPAPAPASSSSPVAVSLVVPAPPPSTTAPAAAPSVPSPASPAITAPAASKIPVISGGNSSRRRCTVRFVRVSTRRPSVGSASKTAMSTHGAPRRVASRVVRKVTCR